MDKVKSKKDVVLEAQKEKKESPLSYIVDICHLNNAEVEPKHQKIRRTSRVPRRHGKR